MKTINSRFGEIEYEEGNLLHFPSGLVGLPELQNFVVVPNKKESPFFWIQSVDDAAMAFILTDPTRFFPQYRVIPEAADMEQLGIDSPDDCLNPVIVTVPEDLQITLNMAAPLLYAPKTNRAIQVVLDGRDEWQTRTPLPTTAVRKER